MVLICGYCKRRVWFWQKNVSGTFEPFHSYYVYHKKCIEDLAYKTIKESKTLKIKRGD